MICVGYYIIIKKDSCIICVGSTGSGKSSTIAIFTGNQVQSVQINLRYRMFKQFIYKCLKSYKKTG